MRVSIEKTVSNVQKRTDAVANHNGQRLIMDWTTIASWAKKHAAKTIDEALSKAEVDKRAQYSSREFDEPL